MRVRTRGDKYITCECWFTVVNDILAVCSRIYSRGGKSQCMLQFFVIHCCTVEISELTTKYLSVRAVRATQISHIFSGYSEDPQYHISKLPSWTVHIHSIVDNPRAALILGRFTRSLTILSATNKAGQILESQLEHLKDKSFYNYIHDESLAHAEECLEKVKCDDSIVYFEFLLRNPHEKYNVGDPDENIDQEEMQVPQGFQAADSTTLRNRGNKQPIYPLEVEVMVFSTSDGLLVVLQRKPAARVSPLRN